MLRPRRLLAVAVAVAALLVLAGPATAAGRYVDQAAAALRSDPVYVAPDANAAWADVAALRARVNGSAVPVYLAILPAAALGETGGDKAELARAVAGQLGRPGVYLVAAGDQVGVGDTSRSLLGGASAPALFRQASQAHPGDRQAVLLDFVDRVKAAAAQAQGGSGSGAGQTGGSSGSGGGLKVFLIVVLVILAVVGVLALRSAQVRRRREAEQLAELKATAQEDLVALGDDIRALDLDTSMPGADPEAVRHYGAAVDAYQRAAESLDRVVRPEQLGAVSAALEEGRFEMAVARAILEGRPPPERRPPCFFDPRHGPSTEDVRWAPPGGAERDVPACAACAQRVRSGVEPPAREVLVGGTPRPYWQAPAYYGPWFGGYFGSGAAGFLGGLLLGEALSGGWGWGGGPGWAGAGDPGWGWNGGSDDGGDGNGGDTGDWGGGDLGGDGGDWGGGDFGGGDFGGGDFG